MIPVTIPSNGIQGDHYLLFATFAGNRYLYDAATGSAHPWPWELTTAQLDRLYAAESADLPDALADLEAPPALTRHVLRWRQKAGGFAASGHALCAACSPAGQRQHACSQHACSHHRHQASALQPSPTTYSNLMLVVTDRCNLRCRYCVFSGEYGDFHTYRPQDMSWETARQAVDHFLAVNDTPAYRAMPHRKLDVAFFGGEPLLQEDLIRQVVEYTRAHAASHYQLHFSMTTNLTHLSEEMIPFLREHHIGLNVSIDGPREEHDRYRVDAAGRGSFDAMYDNLARLRRIDPDYFADYLWSVVTLNGNSDLEAVQEFFDSGDPNIPPVYYVGFIRDMATGDFHRHYPYDQERLAARYAALIGRYHLQKRQQLPVPKHSFLYHLCEEPLLNLYRRTMWPGRAGPPSLTGTCSPGRRIAVATDGALHICERINEEFPIGDAAHGVDPVAVQGVQQAYDAGLPDCDHCWARGICVLCFAQAAHGDHLAPTDEQCDAVRTDLSSHLISLYSLLEAVPDALDAGDPLIDRCRMLQGGLR
jgi:uncharacterized protein